MAGQVVGRVAIKVIPDTTNFRGDLNKELEKIEKSIRKIKVQATFDATGLKSEVLQSLRALNAEMRTNDRYKVKFRAMIESTGMKSEVNKAVREMTALARNQRVNFRAGVVTSTVDLELDQASLNRVKKELERWRDGISPLTVHVQPEMLPGASSVVSARLAFLTRPRLVPIVPVLDKGAAATVAAALAALAGGRLLTKTLDSLWNSLKNLDKNIPVIGTIAEAIAGVSAWGLSAASNLFSLSSSLASIGGAGLALPGIFGGMAIGLGASIAVLKDFNKVIPEVADRLSALQDRMSDRFWNVAETPIRNMIDTLLPEFSKGLERTATSLGGFFGNLSTSLSGVFEPILGSMFDDLNESIDIAGQHTDAFAGIIATLGQVGAGMLPRLAAWFGDIADRFNDWLGAAAADGRLQQWVDNGVDALQDLGRVIGNIGGIFAGLSDIAEAAGGSTLGTFADALQGIEDTVKGSTFSEVMVGALRAAHDAMGTISDQAGPAFSSMMENLGRTVPLIFSLMGQTVGTAMDAIFSALDQPAVMGGLVNMFAGISNAVSSLAPVMAPVGEALGSLFSLIGTMAASFGPVLAAAFGILAPIFTDVVAAIQPLIMMLGPLLTSMITALAPVFQTLGAQIVVIAEAMQPLVEKFQELWNIVAPVLVPALQILAEILGGAIVGAIEGITAVIDGVIQVFQGFSGVITGIMSIFQGDFKEGFAQIWTGLKGIMGGALTAIGGALKTWLNVSILAVFRGGLLKLVGLWRGGWTTISNAGKAIWGAIRGAITAFMNAIRSRWTAIWGGIRQFFSATWQAIRSVVTAVVNAIRGNITGFMAAVRGVVSNGMRAIQGLWRAAWNTIKALLGGIWAGIKSAVTSGVNGMISIVRGIPGKVQAIFAGAANWLWNAGSSIISGLIDGIQSKIGAVQSKLSSLTNMIPDWKGPKKKDKNLLRNAGRLIIEGLNKGLEDRFNSVKKTLTKLTKLIPDNAGKAFKKKMADIRKEMLGGLNEWASIKSEISKLAGGLADKIMDMGDVTKQDTDSYDGIRDSLEGALEQAKAFQEQLKRLKKLGLNGKAYEQIVAAGPESLGIAQSLADSGREGIAEINRLQQELANQAKKAGGVVKDAMYANGGDMAKGLLQGLKDNRKELENEMDSLGKALVNAIKKRLKVHSPSRVMMDVGQNVSKGLAIGIKSVAVEPPEIQPMTQKLAGMVGSHAGSGTTMSRTLNYYAAPGSSLSSTEDLFKAARRGRMAGW